MNQFKNLSNKDRKLLFSAALVIAIFIICLSVFPNWTRDRNLSKAHRYTIATVDSFTFSSDGGTQANYKFHVNRIEYKGSASACCRFSDGECEKGDWILIEYYPLDPEYNNREGDFYFAPNGSINIPPNGWVTIPTSLVNVLEGRQK